MIQCIQDDMEPVVFDFNLGETGPGIQALDLAETMRLESHNDVDVDDNENGAAEAHNPMVLALEVALRARYVRFIGRGMSMRMKATPTSRHLDQRYWPR